MLNHIAAVLLQKGYTEYGEALQGVYVRETKQLVYLVTLSIFDRRIMAEKYDDFQKRIEFLAISRYQKSVQTLHIVLTEDGMFENEELGLIQQLSNIWVVSKDTGRIYIFENQISDFDGLYSVLEHSLFEWYQSGKVKNKFQLTPVNIGIVVLNIIYFIVVISVNRSIDSVYDTDIMLKMGALQYDSFMNGAWYQIVTSLFLHFGIAHLFNNMLLLTYAGCELEKRIGSIFYFLLYFISGICGNVVSLIYYNYIGQPVVSAGASGAIFGVIGGLFVILINRQTKTPDLSPKRLLMLAFFTIYYGLTTMGVDNAAHIGGFVSGIVSGFLLSKISQYGKLK